MYEGQEANRYKPYYESLIGKEGSPGLLSKSKIPVRIGHSGSISSKDIVMLNKLSQTRLMVIYLSNLILLLIKN